MLARSLTLSCWLWTLTRHAAAWGVNQCDCGFYDARTDQLMTEAIITYFNESIELPSHDFTIEEYQNSRERGWNSIYRQAADQKHVKFDRFSSSEVYREQALELVVSPPLANHLLFGGGIRTIRQDIQYGVFDASIVGARPWIGGSAMSMTMHFNDTQSWEMRLSNTNNATIAYMSMLTHDEFPGRDVGLNYSTLSNISLANHTSSPWDFVQLGISWNASKAVFSYNGVEGRTVERATEDRYPIIPGSVRFKHWCTGDAYSMQGPPVNESSAFVGWIRMFFNTSTMSSDAHQDFDRRCSKQMACSTKDMALRGSTAYSKSATIAWVQARPEYALRYWAIATITICTMIGASLVMNAMMRRWMVKSRESRLREEKCVLPSSDKVTSFTEDSPFETPHQSGSNTSALSHESSNSSQLERSDSLRSFQQISRSTTISSGTTVVSAELPPSDVTITRIVSTPFAKARIDYLAGLNTLCALFVTMQHFTLTFTPAVVMSPSNENTHYASDLWVRKTIFPFFLNEIWLGLFFTTSCRFLVERYLQDGNLVVLANKTVGRIPRLMIPVTAMIILEYFLMDCGVLNWLVFLPSITWSPWPYTMVYTNFWLCVDRTLELMYLVPNAFPQIIFNYCTGVLWTIPPTLQGTWTTLLGVIVAAEMVQPWKRVMFYVCAILLNWYARNWGAYFWSGLLLADMDVSFKYRKTLSTKPIIRGTIVLSCLAVSILMNSVDLVFIVTGFEILAYENNIHPDVPTGLPLAQTTRAGYPQYYEPRGTGLIFAIGLQIAVENSVFLQSCVSNRFLMAIFPHTFTMYLVHGLIWWSLGSWVCIQLSSIGTPYWAILIITAVVCYAFLFASLPILTPPLEALGKNLTQAIWETAHEPVLPRLPTLYPFSEDILAQDFDDRKLKKRKRIE